MDDITIILENDSNAEYAREKKRKKRILMAYAARFTAMFVCTVAVILVICGFLYVLERLFWREEAVHGEVSNVFAENNRELVTAVEVGDSGTGSGKIVVLDAGHGGKDDGTSYGSIREKDLVLAVAGYLKEDLEKRGITVLMTREEDTFLSLENRAQVANNAGAELFVSIHADWYEDDSSVSGLTCHYMEGSTGGANAAAMMADSIQAAGGIHVRRTTESDFSVLRNTEMTALLIETGFLSNNGDRENLSQSSYQQKLADAIADGVMDILK